MDSAETTRWALKCKYCGKEQPFLQYAHAGIWTVPATGTLDAFVRLLSDCQQEEGVTGDRQPFLLSGS